MHVADVADALVTLLVSDVNGAVNIGSGRAVKLREIVDLAAEKLDGLELLNYGPVESKFDSPLVMADITKLRDELGWAPEYDLENGINDTIEWWKNELIVTSV
jgi:UDP-glucose 4-epimerase